MCACARTGAGRTVRLPFDSGDREAARVPFLKAAGFAAARREPLAGDASTRRYERLHPASGPPLIFMDQPPAVESAPCAPGARPEMYPTSERVPEGTKPIPMMPWLEPT